jgi:hypothetical protein
MPPGGSDHSGARLFADKVFASRPISRVRYGARKLRARDGHSSGTAVADRLKQPTRATIRRRTCGSLKPRAPLFGFAPGGACHAAHVAIRAVRSYRTVSPLPAKRQAVFFSVALSLGSPPPDINRHRVSMEPGLSSACAAAIQPTGQAEIGVAPGGVNKPFDGQNVRRFVADKALGHSHVSGRGGTRMTKLIVGAAALSMAILLAGCGYTPEQRAASGAALGGATGAAIGAAAGHGPGALFAGGILGAATGAVIGSNTAPPPPPPPPPPPGYYPPVGYGGPPPGYGPPPGAAPPPGYAGAPSGDNGPPPGAAPPPGYAGQSPDNGAPPRCAHMTYDSNGNPVCAD